MPYPIRRNIGLLGGSFDPVHDAHVALALAAAEQFSLDEIRLMPCARQALKKHAPAAPEDRCAMLRLAIAPYPRLMLDCRELYRSGTVYTYDTLCELRRELPDAAFWFIMGMDSVISFGRWHRAAELTGLCRFIVFDRPDCAPPEVPYSPELLRYRLKGPLLDAASSSIRRSLADGEAIRYPIPLLPQRYLRNNKLYLRRISPWK